MGHGKEKHSFHECLYNPWLRMDHLVVLAPRKKKVAPLAKQFPRPPTTRQRRFLTTTPLHFLSLPTAPTAYLRNTVPQPQSGPNDKLVVVWAPGMFFIIYFIFFSTNNTFLFV
jgi:hypothetical protein